MVVLDATTLLYLLDPDAKAPTDPETGQPVAGVRARVEHLIDTVAKDRHRVIIPTPVLSELLVRAGTAGPEYLEILNSSAQFRIADFDQRAAIEVAAMIRSAIDSGDKKGGSASTWAKIKFDRQIVAITKVAGAKTIYSDDSDISRFARTEGISVIRIRDLPLPPKDTQMSLSFLEPDE